MAMHTASRNATMFLPCINLCRTEEGVDNVLRKISVSVDIVWRAWDPQMSIFCMNTLTHKLIRPLPLPFHIAHSNSSQSPLNTKHSYNVYKWVEHTHYLLEAMNEKYQQSESAQIIVGTSKRFFLVILNILINFYSYICFSVLFFER